MSQQNVTHEHDDEIVRLIEQILTPAMASADEAYATVVMRYQLPSAMMVQHLSGALELAQSLGEYQPCHEMVELFVTMLTQTAFLELMLQIIEDEDNDTVAFNKIWQYMRDNNLKVLARQWMLVPIYATRVLRSCYIDVFDGDRGENDVHVDEFLEDTYQLVTNPERVYAHYMLDHFRLPASVKIAREKLMGDKQLFMTYKNKRWQVVGASRMGDIWITKKHKIDASYTDRVWINMVEMTDWSESP